MPSKARQNKIMEKLNRAQKCSILGPQNLGSRGGGRGPPGSMPDERLSVMHYHIPVTRIFGLKVLECPHSSISGVLVWSTAPSPPNENLDRTCHFGFGFGLEFPPPGTYVGAGVWRLIAVSPRIPSRWSSGFLSLRHITH